MAKNSYSLGQVEMKTTNGPRRGMGAAEKPKDFTNAWMMVLKYSRPLRHLIYIGIAGAIISFPVSRALGRYRCARPAAACCSLLLGGLCFLNLAGGAYNPFLYFRF